MANPNNCAACDHKRRPDGGWCYMFRDEPTAECLQHTATKGMTVNEMIGELYALRRRGLAFQSVPTNPNRLKAGKE